MKRSVSGGGVIKETIDLTNDLDEPNNDSIVEPAKKKIKSNDDKAGQASTSKNAANASPNNFKHGHSQKFDPGNKAKGNNQHLSNRERQWMQMGWKPPKNDTNKFSQKNDSRKRAQPLMSVNFPAPDVFSHPSQQFRRSLNPNPTDYIPVIDQLCGAVDMNLIDRKGDWSQLSQSIVRYFNNNQQEREILLRKIELWEALYEKLHSDFDCGLFVTGSTFNGFGSSGCDFDMCMFPEGPTVNDKHWLNLTRQILRKKCRNFIRGNVELINAKVPILKFYDSVGKLEVDLSVNNPTAARNTHLLYCYSQLDYRVRPLVLAVKLWAKKNNINEARFQTLSSYTLSLMMIHYLQTGVSPPVLPCLQRTHSNIFNPNSDIFNLPYNVPQYKSDNKDSIGKLFVGFFQYFSDYERFDTGQDVGSVRTGQVLRGGDCERFARINKLGPGQWTARLLIEEPFERTNAARAVCSDDKWRLIQSVFSSTCDLINKCDKSRLVLNDFVRNIRVGRYS